MTHISIRQVNVRIPVYDGSALRLVRLPSFGRARVGTRHVSHAGNAVIIHALSDLNLEAAEGDRICLIGHNGAGKSTLLRLIARIYPPSSGAIEIDGKVIALLGTSLSLNGDATGYENIRLAADLYDWPRADMAAHVRDIEDFTELGEYLSLPVRIYSAGMTARLAFAMATLQSPDVLLIDEGIGAGDAQFQEKAQARIQSFVGRAKILLLASHSTELCRAICNKALLLANGRAEFFGDVDEGFRRYAGLTGRH
jgi:ABC-type polysaccharide/polyol phosphate transport system ATPase subunit